MNYFKCMLVKEKEVEYTCNNSYEVFQMLKKEIGNYSEEVVGIICRDTKGKVVGLHEVSHGTINSSLIHPREIFKRAVINNADSIVLYHNHPSGDCSPSREDINATSRIKECGELMGIKVIDHVIVTRDSYYSFAEQGKI